MHLVGAIEGGQAQKRAAEHAEDRLFLVPHQQQVGPAAAAEGRGGVWANLDGLAQPGQSRPLGLVPVAQLEGVAHRLGSGPVEGVIEQLHLGVVADFGRLVAAEDDLRRGALIAARLGLGAHLAQQRVQARLAQQGHLAGLVALAPAAVVVIDQLSRPLQQLGCGHVVRPQHEGCLGLRRLQHDAGGELPQGCLRHVDAAKRLRPQHQMDAEDAPAAG